VDYSPKSPTYSPSTPTDQSPVSVKFGSPLEPDYSPGTPMYSPDGTPTYSPDTIAEFVAKPTGSDISTIPDYSPSSPSGPGTPDEISK